MNRKDFMMMFLGCLCRKQWGKGLPKKLFKGGLKELGAYGNYYTGYRYTKSHGFIK